MNPAEFANIANCERDFWWYRGMRKILFACSTGTWRTPDRARARSRAAPDTFPAAPEGTPLARVPWISARCLRYARKMAWTRRGTDATAIPLPAAHSTWCSHRRAGAPGARRRAGAAREMFRVLAPGGLLMVRTAALDILRSRHSNSPTNASASPGAAWWSCLRPRASVWYAAPSQLLADARGPRQIRLWEPLQRGPASTGLEPVAPWLDRLLYAPLAVERPVSAAV